MANSENTPFSLEIAGGVGVRADKVRFQFSRSAGPGGQNVNKVNTRAELWVEIAAIGGLSEAARHRLADLAGRNFTDAGEIHLSSGAYRSQERNRAEVWEKFCEMVLRAMVEPKRRRPTKPTRAAKRKRLHAKQRRSDLKVQRGRIDE